MAEKWEPKPPHILDDTPADENLFEPHLDVAKTIADLIREQEGGKAIALTGPWGSGKSTVVKHLKKELKEPEIPKNDDIRVFEFDAWEHEGDPLRRVFLINLIKFIVQAEWLTKEREKHWQEQLDVLSGRYQESKVTHFYSDKAKCMVKFLFAVPLGLAFMSISSHFDNWFFWFLFIIGTLLALSPFIYLLFINDSDWRPENNTGKLPLDKKEKYDFTSLLLNRTDAQDKTSTISTPKPTSKEFQTFYLDLLGDALSENPNTQASKGVKRRQLVIVIDNLDRIEVDVALEIWSTMRTFFLAESGDTQGWKDRHWLLVPFDSSAIKCLWKEAIDDSCNNKQMAQNKNDIPIAFTEKTFQIYFHVPPPVLWEAQEYFNQQFRRCFDELSHEDDIYNVYRVFSLGRDNRDRPPTPREIKIFMNKLVAIYRQWRMGIALHIQALYAVRDNGTYWCQNTLINKKDILRHVTTTHVGSDWHRCLASIYFNTDPDSAMQLLLEPTIEVAFTEGNPDRLNELRDGEGFTFESCENIVCKLISSFQDDRRLIALSAKALSGARNIDTAEDRAALKNCWRQLTQEAREVAPWNSLDADVKEGLLKLIDNQDNGGIEYEDIDDEVNEYDDCFERRILRSLAISTPERFETGDTTGYRAESWVSNALPVIEMIITKRPNVGIVQWFPANPELFVEFMAALAPNHIDESVMEVFHPGNPDDVIRVLTTRVVRGVYFEQRADAVESMLRTDVSYQWNTLANDIDKLIIDGQITDSDQVIAVLRTLLILMNDNATAKDIILKHTKHGFVLKQLDFETEVPNPKEAALCIYLIHSYLTELGGTVKDLTGPDRARTVYEILMKNPFNNEKARLTMEGYTHICLQDFNANEEQPLHACFEMFDITEAKPFIGAVMKELVQSEKKELIFTPFWVRRYYYRLSKLFAESEMEFFNDVVLSADFINGLISIDFKYIRPGLYNYILENAEPDEAYIEFLVKHLKQIEEEAILSENRRRKPITDTDMARDYPMLFVNIAKRKKGLNFGGGYADLLLKYSLKWQEENKLPPAVEGNGKHLAMAINKNDRAVFLEEIRLHIENKDYKSNILQELYGTLIKRKADKNKE